MADLRCPMCGKPNPETLEVCQFCQARLKPLTAPLGDPIRPGEEPTKKSTAELEHILPEWLRKARNPEAESGSDLAAQPSGVGEMPLAERSEVLEQSSQHPKKEPVDLLSGLVNQSADDEDETPDWLAEIRAESKLPPEQPVAGEAEAHEQADWFTDLREQGVASETPEGDEADHSVAQIGGDLPAWLSGLDTEGQEKDESLSWLAEKQEPPAMAGEGPFFEEKQTGQETGQPIPASPGDEGGLPDWLAGLEAESKPSEAEAGGKTGELLDGADLPAWLGGVEAEAGSATGKPDLAEEPAGPALAGDVPDWLTGLGERTALPEDAPAQTGSSDLPDWLGSLGSESAPPVEGEPALPAGAPAADSGLPDWLGTLRTGSSPPSPDEETQGSPKAPVPFAPDSSVPDWLGAAVQPEEKARPYSSDGSELPDWLASTMEEAPRPEAQEPVQPAEFPDWLSGMATGAAGGELAQTVMPSEPQETTAAETPDWLASLGGAESLAPSTAASPFKDEFPGEAGTSAFVPDEGSSSPGSEDESAFSMDMPDWLSAIRPAEIQAEAAPAAEAAGDEISPAALPSWVQAMRPVEAAVPDVPTSPEGETEAEATGPLAGLRGVLPAGPAIVPGRKPQAYTVKLQADDEQQANAALLEKMLSSESEPKPLTSPSLVFSARVLRWVIFGLLLLAVILPVLARSTFVPEASLFPNETLDAVGAVNQLSPNAPVLLVFDYEPALSGEMEAAAAPLVDHLMVRGARLAIVSTSPNGPMLAERFLARTQTDHNYQAGIQYLNMGYLPGGSTGILGFAQRPARSIPRPPAVNGTPAWETPALQGIENIQSFDLVVVLADSVEAAQAWVEQAEPLMGDAPLLMVASAQVELVLRPYVDSGQIDGLVSGLSGGAAYETINGRPGLGRRYWDSFSLGLFVAEILILVGALWSLITAWLFRRSRAAGEV